MLQFKQTPEDFIVEEVSGFKPDANGDYAIFRLEKRGFTTGAAISVVAKTLHIDHKWVGFAGNKDKQGFTSQLISIRNGSLKQQFSNPEIKITYVGMSNSPIRIGELVGNKFRMKVTSDKPPTERTFMPNYFGEQRFSTNNPRIGEAIVKGDLKLAVELVCATGKEFEEKSKLHLKMHPNDYLGALAMLPKNTLLLYVHSFQSLIFNVELDAYVREKSRSYRLQSVAGQNLAFPNEPIPAAQLPIVGFATKPAPKVMERFLVNPGSFIIRKAPWLSQEGSIREATVSIEDIQLRYLSLDTYEASFYLQKGCYATIAIRSMFEG